MQKAYRQLIADGLPVSADRIRKITGGSKPTVLSHLQVIRSAIAPAGKADSTDSFLHAAADPFLKKIWGVAKQQADAEFAGRIRDLMALQAGLQEDVRDLVESNSVLTKQVEDAELGSSMQRTQDKQLARLLEIVESLKAAETKQRTDTAGLKTVPPDRLPLMWELLSLLQSNETLQGSELKETLEASGYREVNINRARAEALEEGLLALKVTKKGRDLLKGFENLSSKLTINTRRNRDTF